VPRNLGLPTAAGGAARGSNQSIVGVSFGSANIPWANQTLKNFAELTGGQSAVNIYADKALANIDAATRFGYLLGYYPANAALDGKYRHIDIKVSRPGLTVLFRHGYYASEQLVPIDRRNVLTYSRVAAAGDYTNDIKDISFTLKATPVTAAGAMSMTVDISIDPARLAFATVEGRHVGSVQVAIFCGDKQEKVVGQLWRKVDFQVTDETFQQYKSGGVPFTAHIPISAPAAYVKAILYDYDADLVGSVTVKIK
jgi:hypothetical protein